MTVVEILGAVTAAAGVVALLVRAERRARRLANRLLGDGVELGALDRLDAVYRQVHPDHGGSLRDVVDRVERGLAEHVATPRDHAHPRR